MLSIIKLISLALFPHTPGTWDNDKTLFPCQHRGRSFTTNHRGQGKSMLQSKRTLCNQQISVPNSNRKVTMKTCLESLLDKTSPKSIFLIPPLSLLGFLFPISSFLHFSHPRIVFVFFFSFSNYLWLLNTKRFLSKSKPGHSGAQGCALSLRDIVRNVFQ